MVNNNRSNIAPHIRVATLLLIPVILGACTGTSAGPSITDITWTWASLEETEPATISVIPNPENYTLTLAADGSMSLQLDCNKASGSYTLDGDAVSLTVGPSTMAFCGEESLDLLYLELLSRVEGFEQAEGKLSLLLGDGAGRMMFNQG